MIKKRCIDILNTLISKGKSMKAAELAESFQISTRTVRNDLTNINEFLESNNLPIIQNSSNRYYCSFSQYQMKRLHNILNRVNLNEYIMTPEERTRQIILSLLLKEGGKGYETIQDIAEQLQVSRSTITSDLHRVEKWLSKNRLELCGLRAHGLTINGQEIDIRSILVKLLSSNKSQCLESTSKLMRSLHIFPENSVPYIRNLLRKIEKKLAVTFTDAAFETLVLQIYIMLVRIKHFHTVVLDKGQINAVHDKEEFMAAASISDSLEKFFLIKIPHEEVYYLMTLLLSANIISTKYPDRGNWIQLRFDILQLINEFQKNSGKTALSEDSQLFEGLLQHIRPMICRAKYGIEIDNPLLGEIEKNMGTTFALTQKSVQPIQEKYHISLSKAEVGYLTLYFQTALEKTTHFMQRTKKVLIACEAGLGTAKLVQLHIKEIYSVNIVGTIRLQDIPKFLKEHHVDYIISTLPVNIPNMVCITVNPFFRQEDIDKLNCYLPPKRLNNHFYENSINIQDLMDRIEKSAIITDRYQLKKDLADTLCHSIHNFSKKRGLLDFIDESSIELNVNVTKWEDAVRAGGMILQKQGKIESNYIKSMINNVKKMGPYIVVMPGIALPHANQNDSVHDVGFSIVTLNPSISFGNRENDPVKVVISFCTLDQVQHMQALAELMTVIEQKNFLNFIAKVTKKEELLNYIRHIIRLKSEN